MLNRRVCCACNVQYFENHDALKFDRAWDDWQMVKCPALVFENKPRQLGYMKPFWAVPNNCPFMLEQMLEGQHAHDHQTV